MKKERLRGARGSPELEGQPDGRKEGRGGSGKGQEAFKRTGAITDQSTASLDGSLTRYGWKDCKDYLESRIRRCIHTDGEGASRCCDSSPKARGGQQEAEGGEGQRGAG